MVMRNTMIAGLIGMVTGCIKPPAPPGPITAVVRCPDAKNCTVPNGTGVYTAEDGYAGIGLEQMMVMHFINTGSSVTFQSRYLEAGAALWSSLATDGQVLGADYLTEQGLQSGLEVRSVGESDTVPTWTLADRKTGATTTVVGDQILGLTLYIRFTTTTFHTEQYVIDFAGPPIDHSSEPGRPVSSYHMRWRLRDVAGATPETYCHLPAPAGAPPGSNGRPALGPPDSVVFQRGIDVDPVTGEVVRPGAAGSIVTLSCFFGAPATVYRWGYDHVTSTPFYFDAAIQMKRASYCANADHYTIAGTPIARSDDLPPPRGNHDRIARLEASWSPRGALCLNRENMRQPGLGAKFNGTCSGRAIPPCTSPTATSPWLLDGPQP